MRQRWKFRLTPGFLAKVTGEIRGAIKGPWKYGGCIEECEGEPPHPSPS